MGEERTCKARASMKSEFRGLPQIPSGRLLNVSRALRGTSLGARLSSAEVTQHGDPFEPKETPLECVLKKWKLFFFPFTVTVSGLY